MADFFRYVDVDAVGGPGTPEDPYASIASWEANETVKTLGSSDRMIVYCNRESASVDGSLIDIATGWSVAAGGLIHIRTNDTNFDLPDGAATKQCNHLGIFDAGYKIETTTGYASVFQSDQPIYIYGLELESKGTGGQGFSITHPTTGAQTIDSCLVKMVFANSSIGIFNFRGSVRNCLVNNALLGYSVRNFGGGIHDNCVAAYCGTGFASQITGGAQSIFRNCVAFGNVSDYTDQGTGWNASCATNATDEADTAGKPAITQVNIQADEFVDAPGLNLLLANKPGSQLIDTATTIGQFSWCVATNSRPQGAAWDIGFNEYLAAAPPVANPYQMLI